MAYDTYPAVDENYKFPPEIQNNLMAYRGRIPDGTNLNNLRVPGIYNVEGVSHAQTLSNLPPGITTGNVIVIETGQSSGLMQSQLIYAASRGGAWFREVLNTSGTWNSWTPTSWDHSNLPGYTDLNTLKTPGVYRITSQAVARSLINAPAGLDDPSNLLVHETGDPSGLVQTQMMWTTGSQGGMFVRQSIDAAGTFSPWQDIFESTKNYWAQHSLRVSEFKRRRGGCIGTYNFGAVAFRLDHNWDDFIAANGIGFLMDKYGIVGSMAMPAYEFNPAYSNQSTTGSWSDVQVWALNHGLEIMCHSYTHQDAQTIKDLDYEIRQSKEYLEAQMSGIKIDVWAQPGVSPPSGKTAYMGMDSLVNIESIYNSRAGRMLMGNYAVVGGHADGYFRELSGEVDQALTHYTIESETTSTNVINMINQASTTRTGLVLMMHPNVIGTSGNMSLAVLEQIFQHVATLRDQGRIQNLTVGGMSLADSSSDHRRMLSENSYFVDGLTGWTGTGWAMENNYALSPLTTTALTQGRYWSRRAAIAGSWQEFVVEAASSGGASSITITVTDTSNSSLLNISKTLALPTDGTTAQIRIPFGIPYVANASVPPIQPTWSISRSSGARARIYSARVQAI